MSLTHYYFTVLEKTHTVWCTIWVRVKVVEE